MKNLISVIALFSALLLFSNPINAQTKEKETIKNVVASYFKALNAGDKEKVVAQFAPEGVLLAPGAPTATGTAQIRGSYEYVLNTFSFALEQTVSEVIIQGNYAILSSTSKGVLTIKASGEKVEDNFRELFVLQKINGSWKIAKYMYNQPH